MTTVREMTIGELAAFVCSHLDRYGIRVALSGGAVVSIYASGNYVSMDLDFIDLLQTTRRKLKTVL